MNTTINKDWNALKVVLVKVHGVEAQVFNKDYAAWYRPTRVWVPVEQAVKSVNIVDIYKEVV